MTLSSGFEAGVSDQVGVVHVDSVESEELPSSELIGFAVFELEGSALLWGVT